MPEPYHVWPDISIDGTSLSRQADSQLQHVVVEHHQHLPDMFAITFHDPGRDILGAVGVKIGSTAVIKLTPPGSSSAQTLIDGEVTSLEAQYDVNQTSTIIRGYDKSHRLHRGRVTDAYKNVTDSDIAKKVAGDAGLAIGQVDPTSGTHEHVPQANQSYWDFLKSRAREIGYEMGMEDGKFYFRKPIHASGAPQPGDYQNHSDPLQLVLGDDLIELHSRVTSAEQVSTVKARGWDADKKQVVIGSAQAATVAAGSLPDDPGGLANKFGGQTFTAVDRPLATQSEAQTVADSINETIGSSYAEAHGVANGNPQLKAGATVSMGAVGDAFAGKYTLTSARHVFGEDGYRTHFVVSGRQDRTLLGLTSLGSSNGHASAGGAPINGVVVGIVTDNNDPNNQARVKLKFPWLDDNYESDWARLTQLGAGKNRGALWIPEQNDEVLVAFEHGDIRRPFVVGSLYNGVDTPNEGTGLIDNGAVQRRGFISSRGHKFILFDDPNKAGMAFISSDGKLKISLNETKSEIHIASQGKIRVESQDDLTMESKGNLKLSAQQGITLEAQNALDLKGMTASLKTQSPSITIDAGAAKIELSGPEVNINSGALQVM